MLGRVKKGKIRMMKKRWINSAVAAVVLSALMVTPVSATSAEEYRQQAEELKDQKAETEEEVSELQTRLTDLMIKISDLEQQLITKGEEISKAQADLEVAKEKEETQYEAMKLRIKYMYEDGDKAAVEKIFQSGSFAELVQQVEYVNSIHTYDRTELVAYQETKNQIAEMKSSLETEMANLEETEAEFQAQQAELDATLEVKESEVAELDSQISEAEAAAKKAEEEAARAAAEAAAKAAASANGYSYEVPDFGGDISAARQTIVATAYSQLGVPYVWGGTTPNVGLDCSGLTQYCYRMAGISIGRVDTAQRYGGRVTNNPKPGDICWKYGHVAIYIGNGKMIEAQQTGTNIMISNVRVTDYVTYLD